MDLAEESTFATEDNTLLVEGFLDPDKQHTLLRMSDGTILRVATALLFQQEIAGDIASKEREIGDTFTLPLIEERLHAGKKTIKTGTVVLERYVHEYQEQLDIPLAVRTFEIERTVLNCPIDVMPVARNEGDSVIYPVVEEQLVLTKQLILKEEVRITQRDTERRDTRAVTLRRHHIEVVRSGE